MYLYQTLFSTSNSQLMVRVLTSGRGKPEKLWLFEVLLRRRLGLDFYVEWTAETGQYRIETPWGSTLTLPDIFFNAVDTDAGPALWPYPDKPFLLQNPLSPADDIIGLYGNGSYEEEGTNAHCGADLFGAAFFMLSRWEECLPMSRDAHGRFPATASFAVKHGFLHRPVVEEYADFLAQALRLPGTPERHFTVHFSCDVDHPRLWWKAPERLRTLMGETARGGLPALRWWLPRVLYEKQDPFDVFDTWLNLLEKHSLTGHFNFLGKRPRHADAWYDLEHPEVQHTIQHIENRGHVIGFHPSYEGWNNLSAFKAERDNLQQWVRQPVVTGRQHYLRYHPEHTLQVWEAAGMAWDSTLGYPEAPGFRCGTCLSFPVFDLVRRQMLSLEEKPLVAMDVTLALAQALTPEAGMQKLYALARSVQKHRGEMILLWHNSSWNTYFWAPWQPVVRAFLEDFA